MDALAACVASCAPIAGLKRELMWTSDESGGRDPPARPSGEAPPRCDGNEEEVETPSPELGRWAESVRRRLRAKSTDCRTGTVASRRSDRVTGGGDDGGVRPRNLGEGFDEAAGERRTLEAPVDETASLMSARGRLRGKVPDFETLRGDEAQGAPNEIEDLEAYWRRSKGFMKPGWVTRCTPRTNGKSSVSSRSRGAK